MKTLKVLLQEVVSGIKAWVNSNFAQESNTVHKTGNETVNGVKTFTSTSTYNDVCPYCKNTSISGKLTPEVTTSIQTVIVGNSNMWYGNQTYILDANGECFWRWNAGSFRASDQGQGIWGFDFGVKRDFSAVFLRPQFNNSYWLGESDHQWWAVYAKNFYYNGTAWGLDKANVWTGINTFSTASYGEMIRLKNTSLDLSNGNPSVSSACNHMIWWDDKNNTHYAKVQAWTNNNSTAIALTSYFRTDANTVITSSLRNQCGASSKAFFPDSNGDTDLGISTNKWKTLNGISPGSLSFPSEGLTANKDYINIASAILPTGENATNFDNTKYNYYTPSVDGWLALSVKNCSYLSVWSPSMRTGQIAIAPDTTKNQQIMMPVVAGKQLEINIYGDSWHDARLIVPKGNIFS